MGCVVTPIVGRPRPLSRHRHAQTTGTCLYTLICEEPLKAARKEDSERIDRIERQIKVERDMKWVAVQHIRALYAWITQHIPGVEPPAAPDDLAPYVIIPRKDPDT